MRRVVRNAAKAITIKAPRRRKASRLMNPRTRPKVAGHPRNMVRAVRLDRADRAWGQVEAVQDAVGGAAVGDGWHQETGGCKRGAVGEILETVAGRRHTIDRRKVEGLAKRTMIGKNSVIRIYRRNSVP